MKILLIDPPGWQKHSLSLGLGYLASAIRASDFDVQILDMNNHNYSDKRLKKIILDYAPKVIGISVKTSTANISADIIRKLKNIFPDIIYAAGGPHVTLCAKEFIQENKEIDFGIMGEGEISFIRLIKSIKEGRKDVSHISGICYLENGSPTISKAYEILDISKLPFPDFECVKDMDFTDFRYPLLTSRGCPYGCIFCCVGSISGKRWRARSPEDVVDELLQARENYQVSSFEIMDDNFTFGIDRARKICELIIKKKLNMDWWCHNGLRADRLEQGLLNLMKKAGCASIALGIESGDGEVFNNINKGEKLEDIVRAVRMIKKAGIRCVGYFIVGLPGDSIESTKRSVRLQRSLVLSDYKFNMLIPYPGTRIWSAVQEKGRLLTDIKGSYHFGDNIKIPFETDWISRNTLEQCMSLAENQEWARAEANAAKIRKDFNARFGRDIKKVIFIENDSNPAAKNIEIEYNSADVMRIKYEPMQEEIKDKILLESDREGSYFGALFRLMRQEQCQIILDISKKRIFARKIKKTENEYVRDEILPPPWDWDGSARGYFAVKLKKNTSNANSAKNGVIYKDDIALPFSHAPQWEKTPCGKIESGLAFISVSALDQRSGYKADYLSINTDFEILELIISDYKYSFLEKIAEESDVFFCPQALGRLAFVFSRAKMNVVYCGTDLLRFEAVDLISAGSNYFFIRKMKQLLNVKHKIMPIAKYSSFLIRKGGKAFMLYIQILVYASLIKAKNFISAVVRF